MSRTKLDSFTLIGLKLPDKTSNEGGRSSVDCGSLWQRFNEEKIAERITGKSSDEIYAVYFDYEGDYVQSFSYFVGCKVRTRASPPKGIDGLAIPAGQYTIVQAKGKMPDYLINAWENIWRSQKDRGYRFDFEKYDERSRDWSNAEVDIYLS